MTRNVLRDASHDNYIEFWNLFQQCHRTITKAPRYQVHQTWRQDNLDRPRTEELQWRNPTRVWLGYWALVLRISLSVGLKVTLLHGNLTEPGFSNRLKRFCRRNMPQSVNAWFDRQFRRTLYRFMGISTADYSWWRLWSKVGMTAADHSPEFVSLCCFLFDFSGTANVRG